MILRTLTLPAALALSACAALPEDAPTSERPTVYRSESSTGSNIARRDQRTEVTDEERARAQQDAETMMRNEQIRRANMPRPGSTSTGQ
jgi:peptide subunit release factor 1 (eRF1)